MNTADPILPESSSAGNRQQHVDLPVWGGPKNSTQETGQARLNQQAILSRLLNGNHPGTWYAQKVYPYWQQYS